MEDVRSRSLVSWRNARTHSSEKATKTIRLLIPFETGRKLSPSSDDMMLQIQAHSGMIDKALGQVEAILAASTRGLKYNEPNDFDLQTADAHHCSSSTASR